MHVAQGIRTVAALEAAKGLVVLLAGFGLFALLHRDVQQFAEELVRHAHLNPASHTPRVFIDYAGKLDDARLRQLAAAALAYSAVRLVEAYGLWFERVWGEGFAALSAAVYVPFEVRELIHRPGLLSVCLLLVNLAIVLFMVYSLRQRMKLPKDLC
ncbi:DUF2127 domain-containing protein [Massilia suwonensis]|uniref:DUF2127 domain-containing protein n=1 Tax=Massilia suwonensis TaxID=648895 RepID=A0ABW0MSY0_9BURK